jgi:VIT1/CCC1 family predicted Fe2+/Mn2+ transporter
MTLRAWVKSSQVRLDLVAGTVDGILNTLILATRHMLHHGGGADLGLVWRVGAAAALTTLFVFFVAHYATLRAELIRAEQQLNLLRRGVLATSQLGRQSLQEALLGAVLAALCGFTGAATPLLLSRLLPGAAWIALAIAVGLLGVLGALIAYSFRGSILFWSLFIMAGGVLLAVAGAKLALVG